MRLSPLCFSVVASSLARRLDLAVPLVADRGRRALLACADLLSRAIPENNKEGSKILPRQLALQPEIIGFVGNYFHSFVERTRRQGKLIVQPRMGFSDFSEMRRGLEAVCNAPAPTIGTITLDSYTRVGDLARVRQAVELGEVLNGYPIVSQGTERNRRLLEGLLSADFPIQVRHGSPQPEHIIEALIAAGLEATEGGPISYCLPYSRVPLSSAVASWSHSCRKLADLTEEGTMPHLESFGGCMLGQLCPPWDPLESTCRHASLSIL